MLREFIYDHFRLIARKSRMTSIPIISAYYLNPFFGLIDSHKLGLDSCSDSLLPSEISSLPATRYTQGLDEPFAEVQS